MKTTDRRSQLTFNRHVFQVIFNLGTALSPIEPSSVDQNSRPLRDVVFSSHVVPDRPPLLSLLRDDHESVSRLLPQM